MQEFNGFFPAKILSVNVDTKTAMVSIPPYTNGSQGVKAKIAYPMGFDDQNTELLIEGTPDVYVFFEQGRFSAPVIAFYRTHPNSTKDKLTFKQKTIEIHAENMHIKAENIHLDGKVTATNNIDVQGNVNAKGDVVGQGKSLTSHTHGGVQGGSGMTGPAE